MSDTEAAAGEIVESLVSYDYSCSEPVAKSESAAFVVLIGGKAYRVFVQPVS